MNRLIQALHVHGNQHYDRMAIDPVTEFPIDYFLTSQMVKTLATDLREDFHPFWPVAVQLEHGLAQCLLQLAMFEAGIARLPLPDCFTANQVASAIAWSGAQAVYLRTTARIPLRAPVPVASLPCGIAAVMFASGHDGHFGQSRFTAGTLIAVAESLIQTAKPSHFDRHLALLPAWRLLESVAGLFPTILAGGTYVAAPSHHLGLADRERPDYAQMVDAIHNLRITSMAVDAKLLSGLVSELESRPHPLPLLTRVVVGAEIPQSLVDRGRVLGLPLQPIAEPLYIQSTGIRQAARAS
ncbi:hypothetical protein CAF53_23790 [Sphingobium sp. LB126]|uniref:hypothetical protein n=1 Tax=Sphingobium sp. LB126 TaxID=1983755 RepID=UPI000C205568|nr:hypothetical protein [Sphingobium sp. LB126]PJG45719.1 hypothetical protein CAF53_23790 [Sphingobium sp. LB126]